MSDELLAGASAAQNLHGTIAFHSNRDGEFDIYTMNADGSGARNVTNTPGQEFGPSWSPDGQRLAFSSDRTGDFEIFVINADGSGATQLTHSPAAEFEPVWSPDGKQIAFNSNRDGDFDVFLMNADGSGVTKLTQGGGSPASWSPDGRRIAFVSGRDGDLDIYTMRSDGTDIIQLTNDPAIDFGDRAGWSPDGRRFLFSSTRDGGDIDIFVMNVDGTGVTDLTPNDGIQDDDPVWSPDGKHIAFHSTRNGGDEDIWVMDADGSNLVELTFNDDVFDAVPGWTARPLNERTESADEVIAFASDRLGFFNILVARADGFDPVTLTALPYYNGRPSWSHDGRKISYTACRQTDPSCDIYVMNADGSAATDLTNNSTTEHMSVWSPDDQKIAFVSDRDGNWEIYVMNADGSNPVRLTNNPATDWLPTWSPDGRQIAFESDRDGNSEIYVMSVDGSGAVNVTRNPAADGYPAWAPRGNKIAFRSDRDGNGEIYVMNANGSLPVRLTNSGAEEYYPAWSPSGERIAFASDRDGNFEIYTMRADGSSQTRLTNNPAWDADPAWAVIPRASCVSPVLSLTNWWPGEPHYSQHTEEDSFDELDLNRWVPGGNGVVEVRSGRLFVQSAVSGSAQSTVIQTIETFDGDFDVMVDFSDFEIFAPGSPFDFGALRLSVWGAPPSPSNEIILERQFLNGSNSIRGDIITVGGNTEFFETPYAETSGQLRVTRVGSTITLQFRASPSVPFTTLGTTTRPPQPVYFMIGTRNDDYGTGVRGNFDNFIAKTTGADALDVIGTNNGRMSGGAFVSGKFGSAFGLSNGSIRLASQPALSGGFTTLAWVKFDGTNFNVSQEIFNNNQMFLRKNDLVERNTLGVFVTTADENVEPRANSVTAASPGVFYHVAAAWDGNLLSIYVNGALEGQTIRPGPLTSNAVLPQFGQGEQQYVNGNGLYGTLDELAMARRALSAIEVRQIVAPSAALCGL